MGDRGNIAIQEDGQRVYLYAHWAGSDLPEIVRKALARKQRWNDPPYLARIIFCEMVGKRDLNEETGYGISTRIGDNEHPIIVVDCDAQEIHLEAEPDGRHKPVNSTPLKFKAYAELPKADYGTLGHKRDDE